MDAGEGVTRLTYNALGYPEKIISPLGGVRTICYNDFNLPISSQDENNIVTTYRYNAAGLIDQVTQTHEGTTLSYPLGYPDGWNALAYCNNGVTDAVDLWGAKKIYKDNEKKYDDPLVHHSDYILTQYDYSKGLWYNEYCDYDVLTHHEEYDLKEPTTTWFDNLCDAVFDSSAKVTLGYFLAGGACYVVSAVSAYVGAVPVTIVTLKLGTDFMAAAGGTLIVTVPAAALDQYQRSVKDMGTMRLIDHIDNKTTERINVNYRKEYFE